MTQPQARRPKGSGNVRQVPTGWQARIGGQSLGVFRTEALADKALQDEQVDRRRGKAALTRPNARKTVGEYADEWLEWRQTNRRKNKIEPGTVQDYQGTIRNLINRDRIGIGSKRIGTIDEKAYLAFLDRLEREVSSNAAKKAHVVCRMLFRYARHEGAISESPVHEDITVHVDKNDRRKPFFMTLEEVVSLSGSARCTHHRLYIETLIWTGMRPEEVRALTPRALDPDEPLIVVMQTCVDLRGQGVTLQRTTKGHRARHVRVPEGLMVQLREHAVGLRMDSPLFGGTRLGKWVSDSNIHKRWWSPALEASMIRSDPNARIIGRRTKPAPYACRATHVSLLKSTGLPQQEVQNQIGHVIGSEVTDLYTEIALWGQEDLLAVRLRGKGLTLGEVLDRLYEAAWKTHGPKKGQPGHRPASKRPAVTERSRPVAKRVQARRPSVR